MKSQLRDTVATAAVAAFMMSGCTGIGDPEPSPGFDQYEFKIQSTSAQRLIRSDGIPRRAESFDLGAASLPGIEFASYEEPQIVSRRAEATQKLLGRRVADADVVDNGEIYSVTMDHAMAWMAKETGAFELKLREYQRGPTRVNDAGEAVRLALEQVADSGLLKLAEQESLDVVGVTSTHYAGWVPHGEEMEQVRFRNPATGELVSHFKSEYTVYFGRRFRGVPIIGPTLGVRLDADGNMAAFMKHWRDIAAETDQKIDLLPRAEAEAIRSKDLVESLELKSKQCGYVEAPGIGYRQDMPGVGCLFVHDNPEAGGTLNGEKSEWVSLAKDRKLRLTGERILYQPRAVEDPETPVASPDVEPDPDDALHR